MEQNWLEFEQDAPGLFRATFGVYFFKLLLITVFKITLFLCQNIIFMLEFTLRLNEINLRV